MKYNYDSDKECFVREDGLGKKFYINSSEALRIMSLHELGNTVPEIRNKMTFHSKKVSESSINNFINNVKQGNIVVDGDYPVPTVEDLTIEQRISRLEDELDEFKVKYLIQNCEEPTFTDKVRSLFKHE